MSDPKTIRKQRLSDLTNAIGVYALCDLDQVPIYVGQSRDGIRARVQRHLTSARSDVIANRQIDVWEMAYVWAWPVGSLDEIGPLEDHLFSRFDRDSPLMNGKVLDFNPNLRLEVPLKQVIQVIEESERLDRLDPAARLPRQISQYLNLVDYIQTVKDEPHLRRALNAHFNRLVHYHNLFLK